MALHDLVLGLCEYLHIEPLEPNAQGHYEIVFDDQLDVEILPLSDSLLLLRSSIGELPDDKTQHEQFYRTHLQNNLLNLRGQDCSLGLESETGVIWLQQMTRSDRTDVRTFCRLVNKFVNTLEFWRNLDDGPMPTSSPMDLSPFNMIRP